MKKLGWFQILFCAAALVFLAALSGCLRQQGNASSPTGYPSDEVWQPQVMYGDRVYYYEATGFDEELPDGYSYAGNVEETDNKRKPERNFSGSRLEKGQKIYVKSEDSDVIYVEYETGFARFSVSEEKDALEES